MLMAYETKIYHRQGDAALVVSNGGAIEIESGGALNNTGSIDIVSGGALKNAGVDITAELPVSAPSASVAVAGATLVIPVTAKFVSKTTGGVEALSLADGVANQLITISLVVDGGDGTLTPATATGWATIVFADAGDTATLKFIDATVGWIIVGLAGIIGPPVITI